MPACQFPKEAAREGNELRPGISRQEIQRQSGKVRLFLVFFEGGINRLCDMDGRKISNVSDLMSRGAYVLVPVGQTFRDTWYFLPDNAIDTRRDYPSIFILFIYSSNRDRIQDRSAQRDRLLQRREKRNTVKHKTSVRLP